MSADEIPSYEAHCVGRWVGGRFGRQVPVPGSEQGYRFVLATTRRDRTAP